MGAVSCFFVFLTKKNLWRTKNTAFTIGLWQNPSGITHMFASTFAELCGVSQPARFHEKLTGFWMY